MYKKITFVILCFILLLSGGCKNQSFPLDNSFETDIHGTYSLKAYTGDELFWNYSLVINENNSFDYSGTTSGNSANTSGTYETRKITDNLWQIELTVEEENFSPDYEYFLTNGVVLPKKIYKYKNMLGNIIETKDIPKAETFNYKVAINDKNGMVFNDEGWYHACSNINNCQCQQDEFWQKYIVKKGILYFEIDSQWTISGYIIDDYWFTSKFTK